MAEIRAIVTVATTANFAGLGSPTLCAPLLYETTTGDLYALLAPDAVALVGSVAGGSSHTLAMQAFGKHLVAQPATLGDASEIIAARVFSVHDRIAPQQTANEVLETRSLRSAQLPAMWR